MDEKKYSAATELVQNRRCQAGAYNVGSMIGQTETPLA